MFKKIIAFSISFCLIFEQSGFAQVAPGMHVPGYMARLIPPEIFNPVQIRAISFDPSSEKLSLFLDSGDTKAELAAKDTATASELYKYFQVGLRLPNNLFWVNLRPDSPQDIIDPYLETTDVGRILLAADLQLKKDLALFTSPDRPEGKRYWDKLYAKAETLYGQADMEIPTFTRPWIVPGEIIIRESKDGAYIYKAGLRVMLEQDYLKDSPFFSISDPKQKEMNAYSSELLRSEILPKLTREINSAKRYAALRQVYYSLVLAQWFKQKANGQANPFSEAIDTKDLSGLTTLAPWDKNTYYNAYKKSFSEGEYKKEEQVSTASGLLIRAYFSGGVNMMDGGKSFTIRSKGANNLKTQGMFVLSPAQRDAFYRNINLFFLSPDGRNPMTRPISPAGNTVQRAAPLVPDKTISEALRNKALLHTILWVIFNNPGPASREELLTDLGLNAKDGGITMADLAVPVLGTILSGVVSFLALYFGHGRKISPRDALMIMGIVATTAFILFGGLAWDAYNAMWANPALVGLFNFAQPVKNVLKKIRTIPMATEVDRASKKLKDDFINFNNKPFTVDSSGEPGQYTPEARDLLNQIENIVQISQGIRDENAITVLSYIAKESKSGDFMLAALEGLVALGATRELIEIARIGRANWMLKPGISDQEALKLLTDTGEVAEITNAALNSGIRPSIYELNAIVQMSLSDFRHSKIVTRTRALSLLTENPDLIRFITDSQLQDLIADNELLNTYINYAQKQARPEEYSAYLDWMTQERDAAAKLIELAEAQQRDRGTIRIEARSRLLAELNDTETQAKDGGITNISDYVVAFRKFVDELTQQNTDYLMENVRSTALFLHSRGETPTAAEAGISILEYSNIEKVRPDRDIVSVINGFNKDVAQRMRGNQNAEHATNTLFNKDAAAAETHAAMQALLSEAAHAMEIELTQRQNAALKDGGGRTGGIDFRALPLNAQPGVNPAMMQPALDVKALQMLAQDSKIKDLDKEWDRIEKQIAGKAMPYEKMKEYIAVCSERKASGEQLDRVVQCLSNILRLEEACAVSTSAQMKELLVIVETIKT